jgi:cell division septal protein FtsQ
MKNRKSKKQSAPKGKQTPPPAAVPNSALDKYRRRKQAMRRQLAWRVIIAFSLAAVLGVCIWFLPWFRVQRFEVSGNSYHSDEEIIAQTGISPDTHLLTVLSGSLRQRLTGHAAEAEQLLFELLPGAEDISCTIQFPSTVRIEIRERLPQYAYRGTEGWTLVDATGTVIVTGLETPPSGVPEYRGSTEAVQDKQAGQRLPVARTNLARKTALLKSVFHQSDQDQEDGWTLADDIKSVSLEDERVVFNLDLRGEPNLADETAASQSQVFFVLDPEADFKATADALLWVRHVVRSGALTGLGEGRIDLSGEQRAFVPVK